LGGRVAVGLGVKVTVGSGACTGVRVGGSGVGTGVGGIGDGVESGTVGTSVGSAKIDAGSPMISNILSIVPRATNARARDICLPRAINSS